MIRIIPRPVYGRPAIDPVLYRQVRIMAAEQSITMKALTERLLRLGMVAPALADALNAVIEAHCIQPHNVDLAAIAAYDAALNDNGKEIP